MERNSKFIKPLKRKIKKPANQGVGLNIRGTTPKDPLEDAEKVKRPRNSPVSPGQRRAKFFVENRTNKPKCSKNDRNVVDKSAGESPGSETTLSEDPGAPQSISFSDRGGSPSLEAGKNIYKRSSSKYEKKEVSRIRSNPKSEYSLDDADENEKELVLRGTLNDRLNTLALLCARNPSEQNYKQLLQFCENQRNDVIYSTLKLLRDLIKERPVESIYIKGRIIKSFEMGAKNQYIKDKVVEILGVLVRAGIYAEDFVNILVSRLLEKGKTLALVESALKSVFPIHEDLIFQGVEDFYFKNDNFRCQYGVLKFLLGLETRNKSVFFGFYDQALTSLDEYPQDQKELMIELLVNGLSKTISEGDAVTSIDLIRRYVKSSRSIISSLNLLIRTKDPYTESYVLKVSRTTLLRNTKHEPEFLNMIYKLENKDLFSKLIDNSFYYSVQSVLSLLLMAHSKDIEIHSMFSLRLLSNHYSPVVREIANRMLRKEKIQEFDPFDRVYVDGLSRILDNK